MKVKYGVSPSTQTITYHDWFQPPMQKGEDLQHYLGRLFKFLRNCYGLTQSELAKQMGITQPYLSRFEAGKVGSIKKVSKYFRGFGINIDWSVMTFGKVDTPVATKGGKTDE